MATSIVQTPSSTDQEGTLLDGEVSFPRDYHQNGFGYASANGDVLAAPNGVWQGGLPLTSCYDASTVFNEPLNGAAAWPGYGTVPADNIWVTSADGSPSLGSYASVWPMSPTETLTTNPWSPAEQPLPSPLSEVPSYVVNQSAEEKNGFNSGRTSPALAPNPTHSFTSRPSSPAITNLHPNHHHRRPSHPFITKPPKRLADSTPAKQPRPRTLKRHRSDTPSTIASITSATSAPERITNTCNGSTTTLGGVLPANVDPRAAAEQIRREAWQRCRAEAREMEARRMMLLDHEHGALDREAQRLQVNLGLMRAAAAAADKGRDGARDMGEGKGQEGFDGKDRGGEDGDGKGA